MRRAEGATCLLCVVYVGIYGRRGTDCSSKQCDLVVCLSVELQQIECALTHDVNNLCVMADRDSNHSRSGMAGL